MQPGICTVRSLAPTRLASFNVVVQLLLLLVVFPIVANATDVISDSRDVVLHDATYAADLIIERPRRSVTIQNSTFGHLVFLELFSHLTIRIESSMIEALYINSSLFGKTHFLVSGCQIGGIRSIGAIVDEGTLVQVSQSTIAGGAVEPAFAIAELRVDEHATVRFVDTVIAPNVHSNCAFEGIHVNHSALFWMENCTTDLRASEYLVIACYEPNLLAKNSAAIVFLKNAFLTLAGQGQIIFSTLDPLAFDTGRGVLVGNNLTESGEFCGEFCPFIGRSNYYQDGQSMKERNPGTLFASTDVCEPYIDCDFRYTTNVSGVPNSSCTCHCVNPSEGSAFVFDSRCGIVGGSVFITPSASKTMTLIPPTTQPQTTTGATTTSPAPTTTQAPTETTGTTTSTTASSFSTVYATTSMAAAVSTAPPSTLSQTTHPATTTAPPLSPGYRVVSPSSMHLSEASIIHGYNPGVIILEATNAYWNCTHFALLGLKVWCVSSFENTKTGLASRLSTILPSRTYTCNMGTLQYALVGDSQFDILSSEYLWLNVSLGDAFRPLTGKSPVDMSYMLPIPSQINFTVDADFAARPDFVSHDTVRTVQTITEVNTFISAFAGSPQSAMQMQRLPTLFSLSRCSPSIETSLDFMTHPTGVVFGDGALMAYSGACVWNLGSLVTILLIHGTLVLFRTLNDHTPSRQSCAALHFPSLQSVTILPMVQPTIMCATVILRYMKSIATAGENSAAAVVFLFVAGLLVWLVKIHCLEFGAQYKEEEEEDLTCTRSFFCGRGEWCDASESNAAVSRVDPEELQTAAPKPRPSIAAAFLDLSSELFGGLAASTAKDTEMRQDIEAQRPSEGGRSKLWVSSFGLFFDCFGGERQWFACLEVLVSVFAGMIDGWQADTDLSCQAVSFAAVLLYAVYFALLVWLRPYGSTFDTIYSFLAGGVQLLAAVGSAGYLFFQFTKPAELSEQLLVIVAYASIGKMFVDVMLLLRDLYEEHCSPPDATQKKSSKGGGAGGAKGAAERREHYGGNEAVTVRPPPPMPLLPTTIPRKPATATHAAKKSPAVLVVPSDRNDENSVNVPPPAAARGRRLRGKSLRNSKKDASDVL